MRLPSTLLHSAIVLLLIAVGACHSRPCRPCTPGIAVLHSTPSAPPLQERQRALAATQEGGSVIGPAVQFLRAIPLPGATRGARGASLDLRPMDAARDGPAVQGYAALAVEFTDENAQQAFRPVGMSVFSRFNRYADVFVPFDGREEAALIRLQQTPGFLRYQQLADDIVLPPIETPQRSRHAVRGAERIVRGGHAGLTGRGVIIAVVDTGIDFRHEDFIRMEDGKPVSRLLALWDPGSDLHARGIGKPGPLLHPAGLPMGTVFDREDLTKELVRSQTRRGQRIPPTDPEGHGTACAGIAAGNGTASEHRAHAGVAPEADLIGIRLSDDNGGLVFTYLFGAMLDWLDQVAAGRPLVVSCSWGGIYGQPRDGTSVVEGSVSARFGTDARGRALFVAAGNDGNQGKHAALEIGPLDDAKHLAVEAFPNERSANDFMIELCVEQGGDAHESWRVGNTPDLKFVEGRLVRLPGSPDLILRSYFRVLDRRTRPADPRRSIWFWSTSGRRYRADAYLAGAGARFRDDSATEERLVAYLGTASGAITVGSYDWNASFRTAEGLIPLKTADDEDMRIGAISSYSSPGPRRDGGRKPDIVAPGQWFAAPLSGDMELPEEVPVDPARKYWAFCGTSAATPYAAGVCALLLQKEPGLTAAEIQRRFTAAAQLDGFTGRPPTPKAGAGKLNLRAVELLLGAAEKTR